MDMHAHLKNEFREDEKCHNLMSWLKSLEPFCLLPISKAQDVLLGSRDKWSLSAVSSFTFTYTMANNTETRQ